MCAAPPLQAGARTEATHRKPVLCTPNPHPPAVARASSGPARPSPTGIALLRDPHLNKGTAFSDAERRDALGLRGWSPPHVFSESEQEERVLAQVRRGATDLDRYMALSALQERNETLFFRILYRHLDEMMPIVYTPTVGEACQKFGHIYQ